MKIIWKIQIKIYLILIVLTTAFSQYYFSQNMNQEKWEFSLNSSLNFSYRQLIDKNNGAANEAIIQERNEQELWKETISFGSNLNYRVIKNLKIGAGLAFMNLGWKTRKIPLISLIPDPLAPEAVKYYQHFYLLGFPLHVEYEVPTGKVSSVFSIELVPSRLVAERYNSTVYYSDRTEHNNSTSAEEFKPWNLLSGVGIGGAYAFNEKSRILVELNAKLSLNDIIDAPISAKHFFCGLSIGYRTSF